MASAPQFAGAGLQACMAENLENPQAASDAQDGGAMVAGAAPARTANGTPPKQPNSIVTVPMLSPFYSQLANELGGEEGAKALRVKEFLKSDYMMTRLTDQFELTTGQMDGILRKAGASTAWRRSIENRANGTFVAVECPSSVRLIGDQGAVVKQQSIMPKGEIRHVVENTLSDELGKEVVETIVVPPCVLFCADISNPTDSPS